LILIDLIACENGREEEEEGRGGETSKS